MIARKSFFTLLSSFLVQFIGMIGLIILAKLWGDFSVEALGMIGFAMSFLAIFNIVSDLGFGSAHVKRISEGKDIGTCIGTYATVKIFLTAVMVASVFVFLFIWKNVLNNNFYDATTESLIFVFLLYYAFSNLLTIPLVTFSATKEVVKRETPKVVGRAVKVILVCLVGLAGVTTIGTVIVPPAVNWPFFLRPLQQFLATHPVGSLAATYVIDIAVMFIVAMWFLRKYPWKRPSWELFKSYFNFALPMALASTIGIISINIDKVMIGYFWTSTEVGYYFTAQRVVAILTVFHVAVGSLLFPTFSEYHARNKFEEVRQTTHLAERYISMIMIPPIVVVIIFVKPIINIILNAAFLPAASVLIILTFFVLLQGLNEPYGCLITGINRPGVSAKLGITACAINISLNFLFVPRTGVLSPIGINGVNGAALATVISSTFLFLALRLAAKKLTGIKLFQSHTPRHIIAGVGMAFVLYLLVYRTIFFPSICWYHLLGLSFFGLGIYLGILFVLKEFKKQDLFFFLDILHPKEMLAYIKSELRGK